MKEPVSPAFAAKDGGSSAGQHEKILAMVQIALFTAIIAVCSWIQIPLVVPFTLQTFGVFCALAILGGSPALSPFSYILYWARSAYRYSPVFPAASAPCWA